MTRQRTFSVLLAVAVALLGVDLALRLSPQQVTAQEPQVWPPPPVPEPTVVSVSSEQIWFFFGGSGTEEGPTRRWRIIRAWSDGQVDVAMVAFQNESSQFVSFVVPPEVIIPGI